MSSSAFSSITSLTHLLSGFPSFLAAALSVRNSVLVNRTGGRTVRRTSARFFFGGRPTLRECLTPRVYTKIRDRPPLRFLNRADYCIYTNAMQYTLEPFDHRFDLLRVDGREIGFVCRQPWDTGVGVLRLGNLLTRHTVSAESLDELVVAMLAKEKEVAK